MGYKDKIKIDEKLTVFIRDKNSGKINRIVVKKPWHEMSLLEKILHITGIKRQPGTIQIDGKKACARLYGGVTNSESYGVINRIGVSTSNWKTVTITEVSTGVITYDNESNPWTSGVSTSNILLGNSGFPNNPYHSISLGGTLSTTSSYEVWVKVELTIS